MKCEFRMQLLSDFITHSKYFPPRNRLTFIKRSGHQNFCLLDVRVTQMFVRLLRHLRFCERQKLAVKLKKKLVYSSQKDTSSR